MDEQKGWTMDGIDELLGRTPNVGAQTQSQLSRTQMVRRYAGWRTALLLAWLVFLAMSPPRMFGQGLTLNRAETFIPARLAADVDGCSDFDRSRLSLAVGLDRKVYYAQQTGRWPALTSAVYELDTTGRKSLLATGSCISHLAVGLDNILYYYERRTNIIIQITPNGGQSQFANLSTKVSNVVAMYLNGDGQSLGIVDQQNTNEAVVYEMPFNAPALQPAGTVTGICVKGATPVTGIPGLVIHDGSSVYT